MGGEGLKIVILFGVNWNGWKEKESFDECWWSCGLFQQYHSGEALSLFVDPFYFDLLGYREMVFLSVQLGSSCSGRLGNYPGKFFSHCYVFFFLFLLLINLFFIWVFPFWCVLWLVDMKQLWCYGRLFRKWLLIWFILLLSVYLFTLSFDHKLVQLLIWISVTFDKNNSSSL